MMKMNFLVMYNIGMITFHLFSSFQMILEGMGRALHTNFNERFKCDTLKVMDK